jgi:hypothetical protein
VVGETVEDGGDQLDAGSAKSLDQLADRRRVAVADTGPAEEVGTIPETIGQCIWLARP